MRGVAYSLHACGDADCYGAQDAKTAVGAFDGTKLRLVRGQVARASDLSHDLRVWLGVLALVIPADLKRTVWLQSIGWCTSK